MTGIFYVLHTGVERIPEQKADPGEEHSPAAPVEIRTRDLSATSPAL